MALLIPGIRRTNKGLTVGTDGGGVAFYRASIAAAGSSQSDATEISSVVSSVSGADGTKGVILPTRGGHWRIYNEHATNGLKIYPPSGGTINGGSSNAAITIEGKTIAVIDQVSDSNYGAQYTVNT